MSLFKNNTDLQNKKSIVIYFSHTGENYMENGIRNIEKGNTEVIAEMIRDTVKADIFKVEPINKYPYDYHECCNVAEEELHSNARPELQKTLDNIEEYEVIYIGYPIWWATMPMPMFTQLEKLDFTGKIVMPFATHEGSRMGISEKDIKTLCKGATIMRGLAVQGSTVKNAKNKVENWIKNATTK